MTGATEVKAANNYYASGTNSALPGWAMVGERGPEMIRFRGGEQVMPNRGGQAGGTDKLAAKLDRLIALHEQLIGVTAAVPARTGQHVGGVITTRRSGPATTEGR